MSQYEFKLDVFEGPLDVLLHLIQKNKLDIYDIPIVKITEQYMALLDQWNRFDIQYSSDFLVMAATLLHIKSRMLLPQVAASLEEEDPREELVQQLVEFKQMKAFSAQLQELLETQGQAFARPRELSELGVDRQVSMELAMLRKAFFAVLDREEEEMETDEPMHLQKEEYTIDMAVAHIHLWLGQGCLTFQELISRGRERSEKITIFLALLEMLREQLVHLIVGARWDDIQIERGHHDD